MRKVVLVLFSTFSLLSFSELDALNQLQKQTSSMLAGGNNAGRDLEAADHLMGKFHFGEDGKPTWYPTFYPTSGEMGPGSNFTPQLYLAKPFDRRDTILAPVLEIFKKKNSLGRCEENLVPSLLAFQLNVGSEYCMDLSKDEAKKYKVDQSGMASLEESPQQGKYQSALISVFNMDALNQEQKKLFMSDPNASIKAILESLSSDAEKQALVDPRRIKLIKYNPHKDYPLGLGSITAQVGSISVDIPVALPPEPGCQLRIALGQMEPFQPGSTVKFELSVSSVTLSAKKIDGEVEIGEEYDVDLAEAPRFSASAFGSTQKLVDFEFTIPDDFSGSHLPEHPSEMGWMVSAKVAGIVGNNYQSCQLSELARVRRPPAPTCSFVAAKNKLKKDEVTQLTLDCTDPISGPITSVSIDGVDLSEQLPNRVFTHSYKKKNDQNEVVLAVIQGPGGTARPTVEVGPAASCPADDPNYLWLVSLPGNWPWPFRRNSLSQSGSGTIQGITHEVWHSVWNKNAPCPSDAYCMHYRTHTMGFRRWSYIEVGPKFSDKCYVRNADLRNSGCFSKGTRVLMASGSEKLASEVAEGDYVFNPHYNTGIRVRKVVKGPEKKSLYEVKTSKGKVEVTEDHPFLTGRGWVQAMALEKGDKLLGNGEPKLVSQVKKLKYQGPQDVWNFELDSDDPMAHVVIANGIPTGDLVTQLELKKPKAKLP